jgi:hypothetical protein
MKFDVSDTIIIIFFFTTTTTTTTPSSQKSPTGLYPKPLQYSSHLHMLLP